MRHPVWCGPILLFGLCAACGQQPPVASVVTVAVTDPSGGAVPKAEVILTSGVMKPRSNETSQNGDVQFLLEQGGYDVTAHAPGCMSATKHIDVTDSHAVRYALTLQRPSDMQDTCDEVTRLPAHIPIASMPLTETIAETPLQGTLALQPRPFPSAKRTIFARFSAR